MGSRFHPYLPVWFDQGLTSGQFKVPGGRHIVLNQFPRLMKESRLLASAQVDADSLRDFLISINPIVVTVSDGSASGLRRHLDTERGQVPGLRKAFLQIRPRLKLERWFIYTPPLDTMRQSWNQIRDQLGLPGVPSGSVNIEGLEGVQI